MKKLFLDDERNPGDVTWVALESGPWHVVRSYKEACEWVERNGFPDVVSFDHDLGYEAFDTDESGLIVVTDATPAPSGYDFAKWLTELDMDLEGLPEAGMQPEFRFYVHSMNPVGANNIRSLMDNYIRSKGADMIVAIRWWPGDPL